MLRGRSSDCGGNENVQKLHTCAVGLLTSLRVIGYWLLRVCCGEYVWNMSGWENN